LFLALRPTAADAGIAASRADSDGWNQKSAVKIEVHLWGVLASGLYCNSFSLFWVF
jgi:hypothetical protein